MDPLRNFSRCIKFEDLPLGSKYNVPNKFVTSLTEIDVLPFRWWNNLQTINGYAVIEDDQKAGGSGQDIWNNNVNLGFKLGNLKHGLRLLYGEYGGNLNIYVNGSFKNFGNFPDLNNTILGGVSINVIPSWQPNQGLLVLHGEMDEFIFKFKIRRKEYVDKYTFIIGGQELSIDNLCPLK